MSKIAMSEIGINLRPQSMIFTLFGDYIRHRSDRVWIGTLVKILALFDVSEAAVRSTVSRMIRRGWLSNERVDHTSYYLLTPQSREIIAEGVERIFHFPEPTNPWDGSWHLVTYSIPEEHREVRDRFRSELSSLGFGMLTNAVWVSPRDRLAPIQQLANSLHIKPYVQIFQGKLDGLTPCSELVARCWRLDSINIEYAKFIKQYESSFREFQARLRTGAAIESSEYFFRRFMLMHEFRRFPYLDPQLPNELLPRDWRGGQASALFFKYHDLLAEGANAYFDSVFI